MKRKIQPSQSSPVTNVSDQWSYMNKNRTSKTTHSMDKIMRINGFKPLNSDVICYKAKISRNHFNKNPNNDHLPQAVSFLKIGTISNLSLLSFSLLRASLCLWYLPVLLSSWLGLTLFLQAGDLCLTTSGKYSAIISSNSFSPILFST